MKIGQYYFYINRLEDLRMSTAMECFNVEGAGGTTSVFN